jgi:hypothetical protein
MRGEVAIPAERWDSRASATLTTRDRFITTIVHPDLIMIVGFVVIGLLITASLIHSFPDLGETVESFGQFP